MGGYAIFICLVREKQVFLIWCRKHFIDEYYVVNVGYILHCLGVL